MESEAIHCAFHISQVMWNDKRAAQAIAEKVLRGYAETVNAVLCEDQPIRMVQLTEASEYNFGQLQVDAQGRAIRRQPNPSL